MTSHANVSPFESLLVAEGLVTEAQLERARRVTRMLKHERHATDVLVETGQIARVEFERVRRKYRSSLSIAAILAEDGALDDVRAESYRLARAEDALATERELLVESGLVTEEQYLRALGTRHDLPFVEPDASLVDPGLLLRVSVKYLLRHRALPLKIHDGALTAILADPLDADVLGELERSFGVPVKPCCATASSIIEVLHQFERPRDGDGRAPLVEYKDHAHEHAPEEVKSAVSIVNSLLVRALQARASDLHIEPMEKRVRVRIRVDGALHTLTDLPLEFAPQVLSRLKLLAGANIAERRLHQDGRIGARIAGREVDVRVSTYSGMYGESIVMRLLDWRRGLVSMEELGFEAPVLAALRDHALRASSGLVLVTGPTGCGKTTTLYSFVDYLNEPTVKTITAEEPVEYLIEGVTQCSVNQKTGPTFADSLRAIVRQDPDVIVVGEIRDDVTAGLAVEAALTGHQVLSTMHTEDSVGAAVRLIDMKIEPFLVSSTISALVAQRLLRRVCEHCKEAAEPGRDDLRYLGLDAHELTGLPFVRGKGCVRCGGTGYRGRVAIYEMLLPNDDLRDAILNRSPSRTLRQIARGIRSFTTLQESGFLRAVAGVTTLAEVAFNAPRDPGARRPAELMELATERSRA